MKKLLLCDYCTGYRFVIYLLLRRSSNYIIHK